jgi:hypothetical protein
MYSTENVPHPEGKDIGDGLVYDGRERRDCMIKAESGQVPGYTRRSQLSSRFWLLAVVFDRIS